MKTTVSLQEPFSYALWPIIAVGVLILICVGILLFPVIKKMFKRKKTSKPKQVMEVKKVKDISKIKNKYLNELGLIEMELADNRISIRESYMKMSACIRGFVYEVTGIEVLSYTLQDIQRLNMPLLEELIKEFYLPEFAVKSVGDGMASLQKTKRAIERWN